jgi:predicted ribosome quality control (RQC) complex YloA/Tae2 family protein
VLSRLELARAVRILRTGLVGARLQGAVQAAADRLVLSFFAPEGDGAERRRHLLLACDPSGARLSELPRPPAALPRPPAFTQYLRAHLVGARLRGLDCAGEDRLVALDLAARGDDFRLLFSILGRRSNLYLLDAAGRLRATLRPLAETRPELELGAAWQPPASRPPSAGEDRFADVADGDFFAAVEDLYAEAEAEGAHAELRRRVEQVLRREERRLDRKLEKLEAELEAARVATQLARQGELLKGALSRVRRGDDSVEVRDPETGEAVHIPLDRARSPAENLEDIFRRYHKAVRRLTRGGAQDDAVRQARHELAGVRERFAAAASDPGALRRLAEEPPLAGLLRKQAPAAQTARRAPAAREVRIGKRVVPRRLLPRRYGTAGEMGIWVGRSDEGNDLLTTRLARGRDLFFHLDGAPGSHVVLRTEGRDDPPAEAVLDACELAVHFSKQRNAGRADVHVVPIKNVRKPRGAKPGLVMVHGGRTVHLRRSASRLERVLAARIEE